VINGQNAAYKAPAFLEKLRRTREFLINDIMSKFLNSGPMASPKKLAALDLDKKGKDKPRTVSKKTTFDLTQTPPSKASSSFRMPKFPKNFPLLGSASLGTKSTSSLDISSQDDQDDDDIIVGNSQFFSSPNFFERRESEPVRRVSTVDPSFTF